ncbi:MAG: hypothetical protein ACD_75C00167G0003 [uncultured bacterium]|nr:MAG: hypothetical protein ACD_75C00167G0003 [uncultured bacterium]
MTVDIDMALIFIDNGVDDSEAETGAGTNILGGEIRFENLFLNFFAHPRSGVAYFQVKIRAGGHLDIREEVMFGDEPVGKTDGQDAARPLHGLITIGAEIHHDLVDFRGVGNHRLVRFDILANFNGGRNGGPQQFEDLLDDRFDLERYFFRFRLSAEGQDLRNQILGPQGSFADFLKIPLHFLVALGGKGRQLGKAHQGRKDVVEIVGNTPGQRADRLHFLRLAKLPFDPLLFTEIAADTDQQWGLVEEQPGDGKQVRHAFAGIVQEEHFQ